MDKQYTTKEPNVKNSNNPGKRRLPEKAYHQEPKPKNK